MTVELPAPGCGVGRRAHDGEVIQPLAVFVVPVEQVGEVAVEFHYAAGPIKTFGAQAGAHQVEGPFALRLVHLRKIHPLPRVPVHVVPLQPLLIVHGKCGFGALVGRECLQEPLSRLAHRAGRDPGGLGGKQTRLDRAGGRQAFKGLRSGSAAALRAYA